MRTEEACAYLLAAEKGAQVFAHVVAGVDAGLFAAIHRHGEAGVLPATLAHELGYYEDYVRVWCETAYALLLLDHTGDGRFRLGEGFEPLLAGGQPTSMLGYFGVREVFIRERFEQPEFMRTGAVRTYAEHGERFSLAVANLSGPRSDILIQQVYRGVPAVAARLGEGARVLDVGCGAARLPAALAREFPSTTFVGVDADGSALAVGRREIEASGLADRVRLEQCCAAGMTHREEFDLVSLYAVMHELRADIRPEAVRRMWQALRPGGILVSTDQYYPSRLEDFRKGEFYVAVADQASEAVWGNRHLPQEKLAELFAASGFRRSEFHLVHFPGQPSPRLAAIAFK